ncbi:dihydroxyacetone kinase subunit L [Caproiciproducens sp. NJN-50]|uniref:dihydroxyacetone kinase subunit DhaL n=1 Tax=Acutalibacteraceae TaxID=3082771 RepID=UPI000FFE1E52|nr:MULTISPECIES: dihydroxyacetone kinase subunit DhaL [Acutalibacteraceae]QAT50726.1 dihydroxyacetone kinase subunit L [Caproiciproducens sp. NJN-50]
MDDFENSAGKSVLLAMVKAIQENRTFLGDVDGLIGDGDHGANMAKGFTVFENRFAAEETGFSEGLDELGNILFNEIGGSMGPIYGTIFMDMAEAAEGADEIDLPLLAKMLEAGLNGLYEIVDARVGDKTLVDTLSPSVEILKKTAAAGTPFAEALKEMKKAALAGRNSTKDLIAKYGRASRLGERSKGVLDAGAASCCIILTSMADGILALLQNGGNLQ